MKRSAVISPCGRYRYRLDRVWGPRRNQCVFAMLNPSTADAEMDDPTIRRCIGFASGWGYDCLIVINLFAARSADPQALYRAADPVGPDNADHWEIVLQGIADLDPETRKPSGLLVCAWGAHGVYMDQGRNALGWCERECVVPHVLQLTKKGQPGHPLYLPASLKPKRWTA